MPEQPESEATPEVRADEAASAQADEATLVTQTGEPAPVIDAGEPAPVIDADEVLLASVDLARRALLDVTPPETVGGVLGHLVEGEHVLTLLFAADLRGYPGWHWSVTIARVDDGEATVVETELMPGDAALLAPEWVPWSERLADYKAAQEAIAAAAGEVGDAAPDVLVDDASDEFDADDDDDELDEDDDLDDDDDELDDDDDELDDDDDDDDDELDDDDHDDAVDQFDGIDIDALDDSTDDDADGADEADQPLGPPTA
ncbi:DUF3027 domain-containing protein [Agromyces ramosus]|uniref:DUF3027 family protein n=1 Tax=Agromyces ramosus TaxID=33879 RepID=A0ABU0R4P5_9MICO|nr:DUF3027 domain-containing protein [Agromyces ramosus]MDQ0893045.1 hypothetical protein [Agromyces ramosus]